MKNWTDHIRTLAKFEDNIGKQVAFETSASMLDDLHKENDELRRRAEAAERERDRLKEYSYEQALLPSASFNGVRELVNDIQKDATDVGGCYEVSTGHLDALFEAFTDSGACKLLNKFAIEQKIEELEQFLEHLKWNFTWSHAVYSFINERINQLRQQLNGGERWGQ